MRSLTVVTLLAATISAQGPPKPVSIREGPPVAPEAPRIQMIMVGGPSSKLQFMPEAVAAKPGDTIRFMFMDSDNSVIQTTFEAPCAPKAGGFSAGPMPNPSAQVPGPTMDLKIENADALYMTSKAADACGRGMMFSVNAPPAGNTHTQFKAVAIQQSGKGLKSNAIVAQGPVQQIASTVTINAGAVNAAATPGAGGAGGAVSVVAGQGQTGNGQACGCNCVCGSQAPLANAGQGGFGGFFGEMPAGQGMSMPAAGAMAPPPPAAPPAGEAPAAAPMPPMPPMPPMAGM